MALWDRFKVSANGGVPNINDPADAIYTAARVFRQDLHAPPIDGSYHGYFEAACGYYGACAISKVHPDEGLRHIWGYIAALLVGLVAVAAIPWISTGFLPF